MNKYWTEQHSLFVKINATRNSLAIEESPTQRHRVRFCETTNFVYLRRLSVFGEDHWVSGKVRTNRSQDGVPLRSLSSNQNTSRIGRRSCPATASSHPTPSESWNRPRLCTNEEARKPSSRPHHRRWAQHWLPSPDKIFPSRSRCKWRSPPKRRICSCPTTCHIPNFSTECIWESHTRRTCRSVGSDSTFRNTFPSGCPNGIERRTKQSFSSFLKGFVCSYLIF